MKTIYIISFLWGILSCNTPIKAPTNESGYSTADENVRFFSVQEESNLIHEWDREYFMKPYAGQKYYKSKVSTEEKEHLQHVIEEIFNHHDSLIVKIQTVTHQITLKEQLKLSKISFIGNDPLYMLDTLPSNYLVLKNRATLDSILFTVPKGNT